MPNPLGIPDDLYQAGLAVLEQPQQKPANALGIPDDLYREAMGVLSQPSPLPQPEHPKPFPAGPTGEQIAAAKAETERYRQAEQQRLAEARKQAEQQKAVPSLEQKVKGQARGIGLPEWNDDFWSFLEGSGQEARQDMRSDLEKRRVPGEPPLPPLPGDKDYTREAFRKAATAVDAYRKKFWEESDRREEKFRMDQKGILQAAATLAKPDQQLGVFPGDIKAAFLKENSGAEWNDQYDAFAGRLASAFDDAKRIASDGLASSAEANALAKKYRTPEDIALIQYAVHEVAKRYGVNKDKGFLGRFAKSLGKGFFQQPVEAAIGLLPITGDPQQDATWFKILQARDSADPLVPEDYPWLARQALAAGEMVGPMAYMVAGGTAAASTAKALGASAPVAEAAGLGGLAAATAPFEAAGALAELRSKGVPVTGKERAIATGGGLVSGFIEGLEFNPFLRSAKGGLGWLTALVKEATEEGLQGWTNAMTVNLAAKEATGSGVLSPREVLRRGPESFVESLAPLGIIMGATGASGRLLGMRDISDDEAGKLVKEWLASLPESMRPKKPLSEGEIKALVQARRWELDSAKAPPKPTDDTVSPAPAPKPTVEQRASEFIAASPDAAEALVREGKFSTPALEKAGITGLTPKERKAFFELVKGRIQEAGDAKQESQTSQDNAGGGAQQGVRQEGGDTAEGSEGVYAGGREEAEKTVEPAESAAPPPKPTQAREPAQGWTKVEAGKQMPRGQQLTKVGGEWYSRPKPEGDKRAVIPAEEAGIETPEAEAAPPPKPIRKPDSVAEALSQIEREHGYKLQTSTTSPRAATKEAQRLAGKLGLELVPVAPSAGFRGAQVGNRLFVSDSVGGDALWGVVGHEIAHGSGLDRLDVFPAEMVAEASRRRAERASPQYRQRMESDPEFMRREGVATIVGDFMADKAFRDRLFGENPSLWRQIAEWVREILGRGKLSSKAGRGLLQELGTRLKESPATDIVTPNAAETQPAPPQSPQEPAGEAQAEQVPDAARETDKAPEEAIGATQQPPEPPRSETQRLGEQETPTTYVGKRRQGALPGMEEAAAEAIAREERDQAFAPVVDQLRELGGDSFAEDHVRPFRELPDRIIRSVKEDGDAVNVLSDLLESLPEPPPYRGRYNARLRGEKHEDAVNEAFSQALNLAEEELQSLSIDGFRPGEKVDVESYRAAMRVADRGTLERFSFDVEGNVEAEVKFDNGTTGKFPVSDLMKPEEKEAESRAELEQQDVPQKTESPQTAQRPDMEAFYSALKDFVGEGKNDQMWRMGYSEDRVTTVQDQPDFLATDVVGKTFYAPFKHTRDNSYLVWMGGKLVRMAGYELSYPQNAQGVEGIDTTTTPEFREIKEGQEVKHIVSWREDGKERSRAFNSLGKAKEYAKELERQGGNISRTVRVGSRLLKYTERDVKSSDIPRTVFYDPKTDQINTSAVTPEQSRDIQEHLRERYKYVGSNSPADEVQKGIADKTWQEPERSPEEQELRTKERDASGKAMQAEAERGRHEEEAKRMRQSRLHEIAKANGVPAGRGHGSLSSAKKWKPWIDGAAREADADPGVLEQKRLAKVASEEASKWRQVRRDVSVELNQLAMRQLEKDGLAPQPGDVLVSRQQGSKIAVRIEGVNPETGAYEITNGSLVESSGEFYPSYNHTSELSPGAVKNYVKPGESYKSQALVMQVDEAIEAAKTARNAKAENARAKAAAEDMRSRFSKEWDGKATAAKVLDESIPAEADGKEMITNGRMMILADEAPPDFVKRHKTLTEKGKTGSRYSAERKAQGADIIEGARKGARPLELVGFVKSPPTEPGFDAAILTDGDKYVKVQAPYYQYFTNKGYTFAADLAIEHPNVAIQKGGETVGAIAPLSIDDKNTTALIKPLLESLGLGKPPKSQSRSAYATTGGTPQTPPPGTPQPASPMSVPVERAQTKEGKKLLRKLRADWLRQGKKKFGARTINEFVARLVHSRMIVARSQATRRLPGRYLPLPHVWFSRSGVAQYNLHEAGHGLYELMNDKTPLPDTFRAELEALADWSFANEQGASAVDAHEGMAELLRLYITDPSRIDGRLKNTFETILGAEHPELLAGIRDARTAYVYHRSRPVDEQLQAMANETPPSISALGKAASVLYEMAYHIVGPSAAWNYVERSMWKNLAGSTRILVGKTTRALQKLTRDVMGTIPDTPGDVETAHQMIYHVPEVVAQAIFGTGIGKGLSVHAFENGYTKRQKKEIARLRAEGFDVPEEVPYGHYLVLTKHSMADDKLSLGDQWDAFCNYGQYKAALYRYDKMGHQYPGMDTVQPEDLRQWLKNTEKAHPEWERHFKNIQALQDQALLLDWLSGERTADEIIRMKRAHEDYWTLSRRVENVPGGGGSGGYENPTSGIRSAKGSMLPFTPAPEAIYAKIRRSVQAYYDIASKRALIRLQEQMRNHPSWDKLPFAGRKFVESLAVPLRMDIEVAATLSPEEQSKLLADGINKYLEAEKGEPLEDDEIVKPEDVELDAPFKPVFRGAAPRMAQVMSLFDPQTPGKRKYYYVPDRLVFRLMTQAGGSVPSWMMGLLRMGASVTSPWRKMITQNLAFAVRNLPRDTSTAATISEHLGKHMIPGYVQAVGVVENFVGKDAAERMATEMLSRNLEGVTGEKHRGLLASLRQTMSDGLVIPGYMGMSWSERLAAAPGQVSSALSKPVALLNWISGGRWLSEQTESWGRAGAYRAARSEGGSPAYAQREFDRRTGNFIQHSKTQAIAELFRMAGFANPALQITWQLTDQAYHPDPQVRGVFWAAKAPIIAATGVAKAAAAVTLWHLLAGGDDDEIKKRIRREKNRTDLDRTRYWEIGPFRMPFEYGPVGAIESAAYILAMDKMMGHKGDRNVLAHGMLSKATDVLDVRNMVLQPQFRMAWELATNYSSFYDRPIVSDALMDAFPDAPYLQAWPDTPTIYKEFGRTINVSPEKLRYAVRGTFTQMADDVIASISRVSEGRPILGEEPSETPFLGRILARDPRGFSSQPVQDIRALETEYKTVSNRLEDAKKRGELTDEQAASINEQLVQLQIAKAMASVLDDVWEQVKMERARKNPDWPSIRKKEASMTDLAARFFDLYGQKTSDPELKEQLLNSLGKSLQYTHLPSKRLTGETEDEFAARRKAVVEKRQRMMDASSVVEKLSGKAPAPN